jgi:hypothetical protein
LTAVQAKENEMEASNLDDLDKHIRDRYEEAIAYYWAASRANKNWYKITRSLTVIFGALVTLVASLSSSTIFNDSTTVKTLFSLGTPILAASLTIIAGFSQSFQWGSTWQNMVLTAQRLQKEYDIYLVTPPMDRNYQDESEKLNTFVINETEGFFERMLGSAMPGKKGSNKEKK